MNELSQDSLLQARQVVRASLPPTPLLQMDGTAGRFWLKCENLQPTGSFKIRGATFRVAMLSEAERARGVIAYSTGNHAQAVAKAAASAGTACTVVMSPDVPEMKVNATRKWGAKIVMAESTSAARRSVAEALARETAATLIPPYNDMAVMAGQGTIAFELRDQLTRLSGADVYVPVGGGGLLAGVAFALKLLEPACRVIGVEPELESDAAASFRAGHVVAGRGPSASIADAVKVQALGELTFPIIQAFVDDIVTVSEAEIARATVELLDVHHLLVEPAGAMSLAAARRFGEASGRRQVSLLAGGNIAIEQIPGLRTLAG